MTTMKLVDAVSGINPTLHDLELDTSGQIVWVGLIDSTEEYLKEFRQRIKCKLLLFKQEWYLDQRQGVVWTQELLKKGTTNLRIASVFRRALESIQGVSAVKDVSASINRTTRTCAVNFTVFTDTGFKISARDLDFPFMPFAYEVKNNG